MIMKTSPSPAVTNYSCSLHRVQAASFCLCLLSCFTTHTYTTKKTLTQHQLTAHSVSARTYFTMPPGWPLTLIGLDSPPVHLSSMWPVETYLPFSLSRSLTHTDTHTNVGNWYWWPCKLRKGKIRILQEKALKCVTTSHFHHTQTHAHTHFPLIVLFIWNFRAITQLTNRKNSRRRGWEEGVVTEGTSSQDVSQKRSSGRVFPIKFTLPI